MNGILRCTLMAVMMLAAFPNNSSAQNAEWFCPSCGKEGNKGNFCPDCGYRKPVDGVLFFDDMQSGNPSERWCVAELKDFENSGLGVDGTWKVEYSGQPSVLYATRQGCKVIGSTPVTCKSTWTRLHWDAFHEHSKEETSVEETIDYGTLRPAINGHPLFVPENYTIEFDMYLFTPASGPRKDDGEDWCLVSFCGHEFMINTWGKEFYNMFFVGGGSPAVEVTKPGWRHFALRYMNGHADLLLDGTIIAGCPEQHRKEGDNHVGFHAGTNPKFFCVRNVKIQTQ